MTRYLSGFVWLMLLLITESYSQVTQSPDEAFWTQDSDLCVQERETGPDPGECDHPVTWEERWYYDPGTGMCHNFQFSCNGNINNFATENMCQTFCLNDDGPNILDMTLKMNHDGEQSDARILRSDEFRRDARLKVAFLCEVQPEYVRQVNVVPQGKTLLMAFKLVKEARIKPYTSGSVFISKMESNRVRWTYQGITFSAIPRTQTSMYGSNDITVEMRTELISFGAIAVILGLTSCIGTIAMCTILNNLRKTIRTSIEKTQQEKTRHFNRAMKNAA